MDIKMEEDLEEVVEDCPLLSGDLMDHLGMVINTDQFEKYFNLAFQMEAWQMEVHTTASTALVEEEEVMQDSRVLEYTVIASENQQD